MKYCEECDYRYRDDERCLCRDRENDEEGFALDLYLTKVEGDYFDEEGQWLDQTENESEEQG